MAVKLRKVGDARVLSVPQAVVAKVGTTFTVKQTVDGSIIYTPERANPFEGDWFHHDLKQTDVTTEINEFLDNEWSYSTKKD
ncbi:AbrB/MazE/SpoVT family DNA-binding domain-containing protein [Fructilactobacillus cliffordii]|uniref:AbrB/MazE/SpoVT family DNA-binding domain-containing protein n=1 Tax=Fructilactobacillus cliffordii TaxID=2940299 RepID=A0A9Q8ZP51_9LACO|nr:AbrB/MazE/SpoVT family DNA-binding domain-containing protein [Fructilactobacillus cliffordii]USS89005.1 AbrB/MazE/SpoVT family DNA-binding domain-containing protein [Fructilactobacillus cliffordii]